jgi:hypothetical protein
MMAEAFETKARATSVATIAVFIFIMFIRIIRAIRVAIGVFLCRLDQRPGQLPKMDMTPARIPGTKARRSWFISTARIVSEEHPNVDLEQVEAASSRLPKTKRG